MEQIKTKELKDFIDEDKSLLEKVTHEEFIGKKAAPKDSEEVSIDDAYRSYCDIKS